MLAAGDPRAGTSSITFMASRTHLLRRRATPALVALFAFAGCAADAPLRPMFPESENALAAGRAVTAATAFADDFRTLDPTRWERPEHPLGRGWVRAANTRHFGGEAMQLLLTPGTWDGAELATRRSYGYGRFEARLRTTLAPGSVSAFFLYQGGETSDELDIELFNDGSRRVMFTVWRAGVETHTTTRTLPFDPSAGLHRYAIDWEPARVRFLVDDVLYQEWSTDLPRHAMRILANHWWPIWLSGPAPVDGAPLVVDRIVVTPLTADRVPTP